MIAAEILHVDVAGPLETLQVTEVECLIVFWWQDYPVGQLRQSGDPGRSLAVKPLVESSVDPEVLRFAQQASEPGRSQSVRDDLVVSVVICTRDRPGELARCLASLPEQTRVPAPPPCADEKRAGDTASPSQAQVSGGAHGGRHGVISQRELNRKATVRLR